jgi:sulfur relay (sulfurtransferase) DsrC/TusE family protein
VAKDQACKLQILSVKHPDLLHVVDRMFEKFATVPQVRRMIERKYHEDVGLTAVRSYKQKHWQVFKDMVREQKAAMTAISEIIGEDGLTAGVNALLWQELQGMTATQLMAFKKVLNDGAKVELMKKQFALYAQEHRQKMKERSAGTKAAKDGWETGDAAEDYAKAQRVVEQVKEIFGIGMTGTQPPSSPLLTAGKQDPPPGVSPAGGEPVSA